ncbi:Gfo/Idh/MocA family oxidoreductase [Paenibacillus sp. MMS20-IR301]|uniref:Gfo/Idh/MocA family protein n=1 Tax=Paenibacillus sp. MMS20-IR301 TaxID=2895946 RepID=UPI0028F0F8C1|nr:Gfo/Idh/MocA family oxidoreductase [Paenibacillus sp. MMS20-IR301]WNS46655.1 Gfo/Idh/MocA family oxidoreductase [Paenibacillus sp. MMS20-IR301]
MDNNIQWGIIGCGNVTEVKSGPALQKAEGSQLTAVMRRNGELAADYARRHGVSRWYNEAAALIADPGVNAVYVATPPSTHMEYTLAAAQVGKPVYVEKPMARNTAECEAMLDACAQAGVPLYVAYYRRGLPRFRKIKEWLDAGAIGEPRFVRTLHMSKPLTEVRGDNWRVDPNISGGGLFLDLGSHTLDLLDFLLGPVKDVSGHASNMGSPYDPEDTVSGRYQFASGVHGTGIWCFNAYANEDVTEITGSWGSITFSTFAERPIVLRTEEGEHAEHIAHPAHIQQPLIQSIVDELLGRGTAFSTGKTAIRTSRVMDELVRNYRGD